MSERSGPSGADRAFLLILVGSVVLTNVAIRFFTDLGPWARIGLSLVVGSAIAFGIVAVVVRGRRR